MGCVIQLKHYTIVHVMNTNGVPINMYNIKS